jgi:hypothetical protein
MAVLPHEAELLDINDQASTVSYGQSDLSSLGTLLWSSFQMFS